MHNEETLALLALMEGLDDLTDVATELQDVNCRHSDVIHDVVLKLMTATTLLSHSDSIMKEAKECATPHKEGHNDSTDNDEPEDVSLAEMVADDTGFDEDIINEVLNSAYWILRENHEKEADDGKDE